jgi:hypothetical protein
MQGLPGQTVTIADGDRSDIYTFTKLAPLEATDLLHDLASIVMPALGSMYDSAPAAEKTDALAQALGHATAAKEGDVVGGNLERTFLLLFSKFDKAKQREFILKLRTVTYVKQGEGTALLSTVFDAYFMGRPMAIYKWLFAALKAQFPDFFDQARLAIRAFVPK